MNKQFHRVIFNAARGQRMAVHEAASSNSGRGRLKATAIAAFVALSTQGAQSLAQIAGDPSAPANQRPVVVTAPNGTPLVNIQTTSAGGVSRNTYRQFDVGGEGAILNNSRTQAQTQLGGWVQGNPYLANGPARIILNEVNSTHPSQLRGYVEVAGQRAEVIIANPAGIQVNGGGFINANRATLTTGTPKFNEAGSLESFLVRGGTVTVEGAGLDASKTDYAAILARAVQVNAGIWASELKVVAGANEVSADAGSATPTAPSGPAPTFALDVAQLGGMYAGKIMLIGTEAGVGVRNAGDIGAGAGGLVVTADGRLENTGKIHGARVELSSSGANLENQAGGSIEARTVELASATDVVNRGTIRQTGSADLTLQAPSLINTDGGSIGLEPLASDPASGTGGDSGATGSTGAPLGGSGTSPDGSTPGGDVGARAQPDEPAVPGRIVAAGTLRNEGGRIHAGDVKLQTPSVDNSGGSLNVGELDVSGPRFGNVGGTLQVSRGFTARVDQFDNDGGTLRAGGIDIESTAEVRNGDGQLRSNGDIRIDAQGLVQSSGSVTAARDLRIDAGAVQADAGSTFGAGVRSDGSMGDAGSLQIQAGDGLAARGINIAAADLRMQGRSMDLSGSRTSAPDIALFATQGDLDTRGASVVATNALQVQVSSGGATWRNDAGIAQARQLVVAASAISNTGGGTVVQTGDANLALSVRDADGRAGRVDNSGGTIASSGGLQLEAANVRNQGGTVRADGDALLVRAGGLDNDGGLLQSAGELAIDTQGQTLGNANEGKILAKGDVDVSSGALNNAKGVIATDGALRTESGALNNEAGLLQAGDQLSIDTRGQALSNANDGRIVAKGDVGIDSGALNNAKGTVATEGDLRIDSAELKNDAGLLQTDGQLAIDTQGGTLSNANDGKLLAKGVRRGRLEPRLAIR